MPPRPARYELMRFDPHIEHQVQNERLSADTTVPGGRERCRVAAELLDSALLLLRPGAMISIAQNGPSGEL